jgi:hypothetical protein
MNDFSDLEAKLKALRPAPLRDSFVAHVEQAMADPADPAAPTVPATPADNIVRPYQFRRQWILGLGLAAAAAVLLLIRANFRTPETAKRVASASPQSTAIPTESTRPAVPNTFIPAGATQVVYHKRDEGLLFAQNSDQPVRRLRSITQETWQWKNPATGASLRVSYPSEQVELIPVSGQ